MAQSQPTYLADPAEKSSKQMHIVVLTGAGISAESGISTFRDSNGLWENHRIEEVASPQGWARNPALVLDFYNKRRAQARQALPNAGHLALVELAQQHRVSIITQNVDDLHERAGSTDVLHLHGMLDYARSTKNPSHAFRVEGDIALGATAPDGGQLRPHIVWFGEDVPLFPKACDIAASADVLLVVGTSLVVYPAAGLVQYTPRTTPVYLIDPAPAKIAAQGRKVFYVEAPATQGVPLVVAQLRASGAL